MKRAPRSRQRHDLYAKYHDYDSEISDLLGECGLKIRAMIAQHSKKGSGMRIAELAPKMHVAHGIKISTLPEKTWRSYLTARPALYDLDQRGPEAMVRFRPEGFAAAA